MIALLAALGLVTAPAQAPVAAEPFTLPPGGWGRTVCFAGRDWRMRASEVPEGAGPSRWSDDFASARVDARGHLHLWLRPDADGWLGVELATPLLAGWPGVRAVVVTPAQGLPAAVTLGVFVHRNDRSELDIELGRWGDAHAPDAQFAVAPPVRAERLRRFDLGGGRVRLALGWRRGVARFAAHRGRQGARWTTRNDAVPGPLAHRLHLNLWVSHPETMTAQDAVHVIVERVGVRIRGRGRSAGTIGGRCNHVERPPRDHPRARPRR